MQQEQLTINKLQSICGNKSNNPEIFGIGLYDFIKEYDLNPILKDINTNIVNDAQKDNVELNDLAEKALYEMELAYYEFRDHESKKFRKSYNQIFNNIYDFNSCMPIFGYDQIIWKYKILRDFVWSLPEDDLGDAKLLLKESAVLDEELRVQECIFAPSFYLWEKEKDRLEGIKKSFIWYSWDKLAYFYLNYESLSQILNDKDVEELRYHMQRILNYTIDFLVSNNSSVLISEEKYEILYDHDLGKLEVNSNKTEFKINYPSHIILKMLIPKNGHIKQKFLKFENIYTKIMKICDCNKPEPNIYEVCRSINKNIAKTLGLPEFLLIQSDTVQISSKYLR